jgi:hypothetical protein
LEQLYLVLSVPDNSDPRTNGRHYHAIDYATLSASVGALPWLLLCIWSVVDLRRSRLIRKLSATYQLLERRIGRLGIFLILTAPIVITANTVIIRHWPLPAVITPDTALYVDFNEVRTIGYPVFLKTVIALFGDLRLLVAIQLNLLLGSILMLGWAVARVVASLLCGIVLVLVLALNPALLNWTEQLMSEGLFIPVLLVHASLVLLLLKQPSRATAALAGITLVAAILIRPAAYSLLLNLPLLVLLLVRREQITILAWTVIPATACIWLPLVRIEPSWEHGRASLSAGITCWAMWRFSFMAMYQARLRLVRRSIDELRPRLGMPKPKNFRLNFWYTQQICTVRFFIEKLLRYYWTMSNARNPICLTSMAPFGSK